MDFGVLFQVFKRVLWFVVWLLVVGVMYVEVVLVEVGFVFCFMIYFVKGVFDICGFGCDCWIVIEGVIDQGVVCWICCFLVVVKDM